MCKVNFWGLEGSWQKLVVLRENVDNSSSIPESTEQREEESDTQGWEATLKQQTAHDGSHPFVLWGLSSPNHGGAGPATQLLTLELPCQCQALKPMRQIKGARFVVFKPHFKTMLRK